MNEYQEALVQLEHADHRIAELEAEIIVADQLLATRNRVLDAIPECPIHGSQYAPHALEWIAGTIAQADRIAKLEAALDGLYQHTRNNYQICGLNEAAKAALLPRGHQ